MQKFVYFIGLWSELGRLAGLLAWDAHQGFGSPPRMAGSLLPASSSQCCSFCLQFGWNQSSTFNRLWLNPCIAPIWILSVALIFRTPIYDLFLFPSCSLILYSRWVWCLNRSLWCLWSLMSCGDSGDWGPAFKWLNVMISQKIMVELSNLVNQSPELSRCIRLLLWRRLRTWSKTRQCEPNKDLWVKMFKTAENEISRTGLPLKGTSAPVGMGLWEYCKAPVPFLKFVTTVTVCQGVRLLRWHRQAGTEGQPQQLRFCSLLLAPGRVYI